MGKGGGGGLGTTVRAACRAGLCDFFKVYDTHFMS